MRRVGIVGSLLLPALVAVARAQPANAPDPEPVARPQPDGATIAGPSVNVRSTRTDDLRKRVVIVAEGDGAEWEALRTLGRDAFARLPDDAAVPAGYGLELGFVGNERSVVVAPDGTAEVGNGHTMLKDPRGAILAAAPRAKTLAKDFGFGDKSGSCSGNVRNLGPAPVTVTVRCQIIGTFHKPMNALDRMRNTPKPPPTVTVVAEKSQTMKPIKPGKVGKYSFGLGKLQLPPGHGGGFNYMDKFGFDTGFEVDGAAVPYFDDELDGEGRAWLALLDRARKDGFRLHVPYGWTRADLSPQFSAPADFASRPKAQQKKLAAKLWKDLKAHDKKWFAQVPLSLELFVGGKSVGTLERGTFTPR